MKAKLLFLSSFAALLTIAFTGCQKNAADNSQTDAQIATEATQHSDDDARVAAEVDAVSSDADAVLETTAGFSAREQQPQGVICDATVVVDTTVNPRTITITYNGNNCNGTRTRTGVVVISMPQNTRWKIAGAAVTITYQNLKITRIADNKSITINGSKTYTNVTGGLLVNLSALGTIEHTVTSSGMSVTFDNGMQRNWQIARKRTYTYANGVVITISGTHTEGSQTNIAEWGTNRFGRSFSTATTTPLVIRQDCSFRITAGAVTHTTPAFTATSTFGLDANGNATTCPAGSYYMKIVWTGPGGNTHTAILPY